MASFEFLQLNGNLDGPKKDCPYASLGCAMVPMTHTDLLNHLDNDSLTHTQLMTTFVLDLKSYTEIRRPKWIKEKLMLLISFIILMGSVAILLHTWHTNGTTEARLQAMVNKHERDVENRLLILKSNKVPLVEVETSNVKTTSAMLEERIVSLEKEMKDDNERIILLEKENNENKNKIMKLRKKNDDEDEKEEENEKEIKYNKNSIKAIEVKIRKTKESITTLNLDSQEKEKRILELESQGNINKNFVSFVKTRIDPLQAQINELNVGTNKIVAIGVIAFIVTNLEERKKNHNRAYSPYFYSHANGYKLRLEIDAGGWSDGKGSHLSAGIIIYKGEYDDVLLWPCKYSFEISIVDQKSGKEHNKLTLNHDESADNHKYTFNKPINSENQGYGYPQYISHSVLANTNGLVVNDSIMFKCTAIKPK